MTSAINPPLLTRPPQLAYADERVGPVIESASQANHAALGGVIATVAPRNLLIQPELTIELDAAAQRFVQTLTDPESQSVLRRYPAESQLAFSRGVTAYAMAMQRA